MDIKIHLLPKIISSETYALFIYLPLLIILCCSRVNAQSTISPKFVTQPVKYDSDDPAIWLNKQDPSASLILGTDKKQAGALYVFNMEGKIIADKVIRDLKIPNNVDVTYGFKLQGRSIDLAVVTERVTSKLRIYAVPDMRAIDNGGITVFAGEKGEGFREPMGIALYKQAKDDKLYAIVSRKAGPKDGTYLWQYLLQDDGKGSIKATLVRKFGRFSGKQEIEAIAVDQELGYVYYSDERAGVRKYYADPARGNQELAVFGATGYASEQEGISIYKIADGTGYILVSDQFSNEFHIYTREGTAGDPHNHKQVKVVKVKAKESDGSEVINHPILPYFPNGVFVAMSKDRTFHLYRWEDIAGKDLKIEPATEGRAPLAPALIAPANQATGISTAPVLTWSASAGAGSYQVQVSGTSNFSAIAFNQSNLSETSVSVSGLATNTPYYWRVKATGEGGSSNWSDTWKFTTKNISKPEVVSIQRFAPATAVTSAKEVTFRVIFSERVTGVDTGDFTVFSTGTVKGDVTGLTEADTKGTTYDVKVGKIAGKGSLRLDLKSSGTGITNVAGNPVAGYTSGQSYSIQQVSPVIQITAPSNGATFKAPASIPIAATATDGDGSVVKVEFFSGSARLGEDVTSPYNFSWNQVAAGSYTIIAKATDNEGVSATSEPITVSVTLNTIYQWSMRYGGDSDDSLSQIIQTADGGYLLGGTSVSDVSGDKTQDSRGGQDFWIVKTDGTGSKEWDKRYGGSGEERLQAVIQAADGGYLLGGSTTSDSSGDLTQSSKGKSDFWVVKVSETGDMQWEKRYGGRADESVKDVAQLTTGEFIVAGESVSGASGDKTQPSRGEQDYWVLKLSNSGNLVWDKRFGGSEAESLEGLVVHSDGSFVLAGTSASGKNGDKKQGSWGLADYFIVKVDSSGSKVWDRSFGGTARDNLSAVTATTDGGYLLGGTSFSGSTGNKAQDNRGSSDFWIIKTDSRGGKEWDRRFGGDKEEHLHTVVQASDGGYLLGGSSASGISGDKTQSGHGSTDYWTVKVNRKGAGVWDKRFGGNRQDELIAVLHTSDDGYLLAGHTLSGLGNDIDYPERGGADFWAVKVSASGNGSSVSAAPTPDVDDPDEEPGKTKSNLQVYPNPITEKAAIHVFLDSTQLVSLQVYDMQGRLIADLFEGELLANTAYQFEWNPEGRYAAGVYMLRLQSTSFNRSRKILVNR